MTGVLFICTGNICRSPTAEGVFRHMVRQRGLEDQFEIDSVGMIAYHVGEAPDPRSRATARAHGFPIDDLRARQFSGADCHRFDYLLAMDQGHLRDLTARVPVDLHHKLHLFLSFLPDAETLDVPDPYYGGQDGFETTYDLIFRGCESLLDRLTQ